MKFDIYLKTSNKELSLKKATFYAEESCKIKGGFKIKNFIKEFNY